MVLHLALAAKLNLSIAFRGSVLSPTCLLLCFIVKLSISNPWFQRTLDDTSHGFRLFLFQLSRIVFGPENVNDNDPSSPGRWNRAARLLRQCVGGTQSAIEEDAASYQVLSMTAL
ncbi:hypothetical protein MLD38_023530 [Melastoma candidum]|uniref:Uncharacterized protein n=1 Tax=Melastoma candidum TaxID=119954 RepID=A0ACB9NQK9_9MYRT|nr:hypothetical protein MLD38_023530 [Melastoma candidum]